MAPVMSFTHSARDRMIVPLSIAPASNLPKFAEAANGIVPGYQGHVPGARDVYGTTPVGGLSYEKWAKLGHAGPQARHDKPDQADANNSRNIQFLKEVNGVVPGCTCSHAIHDVICRTFFSNSFPLLKLPFSFRGR